VYEGILNLDKPVGPTSHDIVQQLRRLAGARRVGHAGTLDPLASGVLLLAIGRATRLLEYLAGQPKCYEATVRLGQTTATYDAESEVLVERSIEVGTGDIQAALDTFYGTIWQRPPAFSAVKVGGRPLYKLARQGAPVEAALRPVTIYDLELLAWQPPLLTLRLLCSTGTYVRSLAHDLGQALGCGGHLAALRRTAIGRFTVADAAPLAMLSAESLPGWLRPSDEAVAHLPRLELSADESIRLRQGQPVTARPDDPDEPLGRAYDPAGRFLGLASRAGAVWQARKILV
jgi:tRNA pseudouridine55 synthase